MALSAKGDGAENYSFKYTFMRKEKLQEKYCTFRTKFYSKEWILNKNIFLVCLAAFKRQYE